MNTSSTYRIASLVTLLVGGILLAACGGGSPSSPPLTKQQFIKRADALCERADEEQTRLFGEIPRAASGGGATRAGQEELVRKAGLPPVEAAAQGIGELTPPSADAKELEAFVAAMEQAVREGEEQPLRILEGSIDNPFEPVEEMARKYGFKACSEPL